MAEQGTEYVICKIMGKNEVKAFLEELGFVQGQAVKVICEYNGNLIVMVKNSRIALSREMAHKILV